MVASATPAAAEGVNAPEPRRPNVGILTQIGYGVGSIGYGVAGQSLATALLTFYLNQVIGVPVAYVGAALALSLVFDAIVDPLVGQWSDNTRTRWGRRHPFMYASAIPCGLLFFFVWHAPRGFTPMETFAYTMALLVAVRFCVALYETGSSALAPELAPDYHKRTGLLAWRWFFGVAGSGVMVYVLNNLYLKKDPLNRLAYEQFSTVTAVVIVLAIIASSLATHRMIPYLTTPAKRPITLMQTVREVLGTLTNPSLVVLMASGFMSGISGGIGASLNTYFYYHLWGLTPLSVTPILIAYVPAAVIGSVLAPFASRLMGKKASMITLFFISLSASVIPLILRLMGILPGTGEPWVVLILAADAFVAGALGIMGFIIVNSMIADVVEDAATKTGVRSEGLLLAANGLLPKFTTAFGAFVGTLMIAAAHFPPHARPGTVPFEIMRNLALLYLPTYLVLTSLAIGVLGFYRIDEKTHRQNLERLDEVGLGADVARDTSVSTPGGPFPGVNS